ncbi:MAG TPA: phosphotransferase [Candidatus Saccharimonadales bacterium]|jgi:Ser/Thr protein kinase RdoA (MazF antagonist)|nr:phosphotransferase [Candidatus Saccharimonadales bacterium]
MDKNVIARILEMYGVKYTRQLAVQKGYRNESHAVALAGGTMLNLIMYKNEPGILAKIKNANHVSNYLAGQGFPARQTYDDRIAQLKSPTGAVKYGSLYAYLPGKTIPWETYTMEHLKTLGQTMSDMHAALKNLPGGGLPPVADEYIAILDRMERYFNDPQVATAIARKLQLKVDTTTIPNLKRLLRKTKTLPGQQVLHMDFVRGNVLFDDTAGQTAISGILDFEKTAYGHPLFDIARTTAFLLVDCKYKEAEKVRKYFLQSGYTKRGTSKFKHVTIEGNETTLFENLINLFLLHDFYKFLRHNPYEHLQENEHYLRTVASLAILR